jgi:hypothetical protein
VIENGDSNSMNIKDLSHERELAKVLINIKNKNTARFDPSFKCGFGLLYQEIDGHRFEEQLKFFEHLENIGIVKGEPSGSVLKCNFCNSFNFCISPVCTFCSSANIIRGTAIQHDLCSNIDFDYKYLKADNTLVCEKCNKSLKAIGVDYSKLGYFYKCLACKAMLPSVEQQYMCLGCGHISNQDEVQLQQIYSYKVELEKLSEMLNNGNYMFSVVEELERIGVKSIFSGTLTGISKIQHTFALVVYDKDDIPTLVVDTIVSGNTIEETLVFSFIARCLDVKIQNRILLAIPAMRKNLRELANSQGIIVIDSETKDEAVLEIVQTITQICNKIEIAK